MKDETLAVALRTVHSLLESSASDSRHFPPTLLYNEGWLLRLILDWFAAHELPGHRLNFALNASWYSEAYLPSAFAARRRGDPLAEASTHADAVVGHFEIGARAKSDLSLRPDATQFTVLEGKLFSRLSTGVKNVATFDQAARSVACIAEALRRAGRQPAFLQHLGFYVLAPQIQSASFSAVMSRSSILQKVESRVRAYDGDLDGWFDTWFRPTLDRIDLVTLNWEDVITAITGRDSVSGQAIGRFYALCAEYNQRSSKRGRRTS